MILVNRFDAQPIGKTTKTPGGFLRVAAALTREGIFDYLRADGTVQREFRPAGEVLSDAVLETLAGVPVTRDHPRAGFVNVDNVKELQVGHLDGGVRREGDHAIGMMTITDAGVVKDIEDGKLAEVSLGYSARYDPTPGIFNGQRYDGVQRGLVYNHVAVGPKGWARGGPSMKIRLDGNGAVMVGPSSTSAPHESATGATSMEFIIIRLDGIEVKVEKSLGPVVEKAIADRDAKIAANAKTTEAAQARFDALTTELATAKASLAKALDPKTIEAAVNERATLEVAARKILGATARFDSKSADAIRREVITKASPATKLDDKSEEYVTVFFDAVTTPLPPPRRSSPTRPAARAPRRRRTTRRPRPPTTRAGR